MRLAVTVALCALPISTSADVYPACTMTTILAQMSTDVDIVVSGVEDYNFRGCIERHLGELGRDDVRFLDEAAMEQFFAAEVPIRFLDQRTAESGTNMVRLAATAMIDNGNLNASGPANDYNYDILGIARFNQTDASMRGQYDALGALAAMEPMALQSNPDLIRQDFVVYEIECN